MSGRIGKSIVWGVLAAGLAVAGQGIAEEAKAKPPPINCATAEGDLRVLNAEKQHAEQQEVLGITAITPAGALFGLVTGTEQKHLKMLSGDYVKQIDARIDAVNQKCGL